MYLESFESKEPVDIESLKKEAAVAATLFIHKMKNRLGKQRTQDVNQWQNIAWREQMAGNF
jgi:hypothetical protein